MAFKVAYLKTSISRISGCIFVKKASFCVLDSKFALKMCELAWRQRFSRKGGVVSGVVIKLSTKLDGFNEPSFLCHLVHNKALKWSFEF